MNPEKVKKVLVNVSMYILVFLIVLSASMLVIKNNMQASDTLSLNEVYEVEEEVTVQYHFLNILMQEEVVRPINDGGIEITTVNHPSHFLVPSVISVILTSIIFYISLVVRNINKNKVL